MTKKVTIVPKDKCPLDILADLGSRTENAWIYFHKNVVEKLQETCNKYAKYDHCINLTWYTTKEKPGRRVHIREKEGGCWQPVYFIIAENIAFDTRVDDPDEIFFIKMDE